MTAPTIYRWDDPGAPSLTNAGSAVYEIIKACLVDGYSGKPAAGWATLYDSWGSNGRASIQNSGKSGVLGMLRPSGTHESTMLYVADGMADQNTPVAAKSGRILISDLDTVDANSRRYQRALEVGIPNEWVVIANANFAILWTIGDGNSFNGPATDATGITGLYSMAFGALDSCRGLGKGQSALLGNFVILGGYHNVSNRGYGYNYSRWANNEDYTNHGTVDISANGERINPCGTFFPAIMDKHTISLVSANAKARFRLTPLDVVASNGQLRNGWQIGSANMILHDSTLSIGTGAFAAMNALNKERLKDIIDIDGKQYVTAFVRGDAPVFISLAAEDWS